MSLGLDKHFKYNSLCISMGLSPCRSGKARREMVRCSSFERVPWSVRQFSMVMAYAAECERQKILRKQSMMWTCWDANTRPSALMFSTNVQCRLYILVVATFQFTPKNWRVNALTR
jgi:hypothetical protein